MVLSEELIKADTLTNMENHNACYEIRGLLADRLTEKLIVEVSNLDNQSSYAAKVYCQVCQQELDVWYHKCAIKNC